MTLIFREPLFGMTEPLRGAVIFTAGAMESADGVPDGLGDGDGVGLEEGDGDGVTVVVGVGDTVGDGDGLGEIVGVGLGSITGHGVLIDTLAFGE